jgi:hypothetical protein
MEVENRRSVAQLDRAKLTATAGKLSWPFMTEGSKVRSAILALLAEREPAKTVCPSEVARRIDANAWRPLMPQVRDVAIRLAREGIIEVTQRGAPISLDSFHGPIRLRLCSKDCLSKEKHLS